MTGRAPLPESIAGHRGWGVFLSRVVREWDSHAAAKHAAKVREARIRTVALCASAEDGWEARHDVLAACAETYAELAGARTVLYALYNPRKFSDDPVGCAKRLHAARIACGAFGVIGDHELATKGRRTAAILYRGAMIDGADEGTWIAGTSYPIPSFHPDVPWADLVFGHAQIPQFYASAAHTGLIARGLREYADLGVPITSIQPAIAGYDTASPGEGVEQLVGDMGRVLLDEHDRPRFSAAWVWQDSALDRDERKILGAFADRHGW